jgi:S-formylglutathione hydrolase FrmB
VHWVDDLPKSVKANSRRAVVIALTTTCVAGFASAAGADELPYNTVPPFLSGPVQEGFSNVLSVAAGSWGGKHLVFTYSWERCDASGANCAPISGASETTRFASVEYVLTPDDAGHRIQTRVTARNAIGATTRLSNQSIVLPAPRFRLPPSAVGTIADYSFFSSALGHVQHLTVFLPPGYRVSRSVGYPTLYLLHGFPGSPSSFAQGLAVGPTEAQLLAMKQMRPLILVMPDGAPADRSDTAWVDSPQTGSWETFVSRDVVHWVDRCFRTNASRSGRGIGGLSEGGYGALNIAIHNPTEFRLVESWSGYEHADPTQTAIYGTNSNLLQYNSPAIQIRTVYRALRRYHVRFWFYVGSDDGTRAENTAFAAQLARARIRHTFRVVPGSHLPRVYRANLPEALRVASSQLTTKVRKSLAAKRGADCNPLPAGPAG